MANHQPDGISDWILNEVRKRFGNSKSVTKERIFYYVYGIIYDLLLSVINLSVQTVGIINSLPRLKF